MFPVLRVVDEQFSAHPCASYQSFVQSPAMSCAEHPPAVSSLSFQPSVSVCQTTPSTSFELIDDAKIQQIQIDTTDSDAANGLFSCFPKNRPTFQRLSEKPSDIALFGFENTLKSQGKQSDSPCCDITYTYNLHVSEINMSVRPLTYRRWRSGCNSLNIIY